MVSWAIELTCEGSERGCQCVCASSEHAGSGLGPWCLTLMLVPLPCRPPSSPLSCAPSSNEISRSGSISGSRVRVVAHPRAADDSAWQGRAKGEAERADQPPGREDVGRLPSSTCCEKPAKQSEKQRATLTRKGTAGVCRMHGGRTSTHGPPTAPVDRGDGVLRAADRGYEAHKLPPAGYDFPPGVISKHTSTASPAPPNEF
jgi:hypothetical protein